MIAKIFRTFLIGVMSLLLLFCILFATLQTKWARDMVRAKIISYFNERGISVYLSDLSGQPPFSWSIEDADLKFNDSSALQLSHVKLRVAILPLLQGRLDINYLKVENGTYSFTPVETTSDLKTLFKEQIASANLPFPITISYLTLSHLTIWDKSTQKTISFGLSGSAGVRQDKSEFDLDLHFLSPDQSQTYLELVLSGSKLRNFVSAKVKWNLELPPFLAPHICGQTVGDVDLKGPWTSWEGILNDTPFSSPALIGEAKGIVDDTKFTDHPLFDRKWKFIALLAIPSSDEIDVRQFALTSDLVTLKGKARVVHEIAKTQAAFDITLPDLALFTPLATFPVSGSAEGKAIYQEGAFKASLETHDLKLDAFAAMTTQALIKGNVSGNDWKAEVKISSQDAQIPFENSFAFEYAPASQFSLTDFELKIPEGDLNGFLSYDCVRKLCEGSLFVSVQHLDRFTFLFKDQNFGGSVAAECRLFSQDGEQSGKCAAIGKNLRYNEILLDDITMSAEVINAFDDPHGKISLLAEKVYTPSFYLDRLNFNTSSSEENWPFFLDMEGRIENPFQCYAKGFWKKENPLFTLELTQLYGDLSSTPFALKYPCELEWGAESLTLSPFDFTIGPGHFYTRFDLSPVRSLGKWELTHFPLEVLGVFRPRFNLKGLVSTQGYFDSYDDNLEGVCNAVLEDANVLHFGKKEPFRAKGSLQAHLNNNALQIHTDLQAIDEQFLNFTATLPIVYNLYPFRIALDETKNTSAELLAEGKLQDLFDFVNLGTNNFTGLVSARLFLSKTLADPSLQGHLDWQNGTFENYFTGIVLKNIDAQFEAQNDTVYLTELTATDEKQGKVTADGKIYLKPKEHFPYTFTAEMQNLHALGFDMIDCNLTGPVYFKGNTQDMYAEGNLIVDEAMIQLTERLPYEIPSLPVTYVNRPPHLASKPLPKGPGFAFHIDLEVTADDKVHVEGRGLNAELQGHVRLQGINFNILPSGSLKLIKGEYQFAGKIFKLTEGEIVFNDKPTFSSYVNLNGVLTMPDITITAMLRGPLTSPQLTFQSNPQKSTSSILALILFNKDIADISHPEAIQLANTLMSMSGGAGPDVLEAIRKSIGVDRLTISSAKPGSDEIAVQIGKYLTKGILITLSQSATSSQVIVEVELPKGFVFTAETQEEQEGKFTLKWTKSY